MTFQPSIFILRLSKLTGRTDTEDEAPTFCPPDVMSRLIGKDSDAGKD